MKFPCGCQLAGVPGVERYVCRHQAWMAKDAVAGSVTTKGEREIRLARVKENVARMERLVGWLTFFRQPGEVGVGDTARRFNMRTCKKPQLHRLLKRLIEACDCKDEDAIPRLNQRFPY